MNGSVAGASSLDTVDYDPVQHLNQLFAHPSAVSSVSRVSDSLQARRDELSAHIAGLESAQAYSPDSSLERMQSAQAELAGLFRKIETVRSRAIQTEQNITSMTADIKRLDGTKRNLTLSMTALKRLQMLTTAYEQLHGLARSRQYRDCASLLQAVLQLMRHFHSYRSIDQIATLSRGVADLQRELLDQVCEDFEMAFAKDDVQARRPTLVEACAVMDALGDHARHRLLTWYLNTQLREYRSVFRGNDEAGNLDNIDRRYAWFKRMIKRHEDEHAALFPPHWRVAEALAQAFCDGTRDDYKTILEKSISARRLEGGGAGSGSGSGSGPRLDVNLLLACLQETMDFEQSLERRFASEPRASIDTVSSADDPRQTFNGSISVAFEPYLSLWVESQDRALAAMIPKYRAQPLLPPDDEFSPQAVIASAIELFHFYKLTLSQCAKLSTSDRLLDLARTLAKYLDEYAQQVLLAILQRPGPSAASLQDIVLVLNTADFWHTNAGQLEDNIKKRIDPELKPRVDLSSQADAFLGVASAAVIALVSKVEADCQGAWREMKNTNWSSMDTVADQSSYVAELLRHVRARTAEILALVGGKQQYARAFADNLVEHLANAYIANIIQCRPVSEVGAEQMLLDKYVLTKAFENLLTLNSSNANNTTPNPNNNESGSGSAPPTPQPNNPPPPASFVKRVNATMTRIDPLLKTLQVRPAPPEGLVQAYLIHVADRSDANFRKILELKGIRGKGDQAHLYDMFVIHRDSSAYNGKLAAQSPLLTPLLQQQQQTANPNQSYSSSSAAAAAGSGVGGTISPAAAALSGVASGRFDAATFGERLLNAARDGVERIGTPQQQQQDQNDGGTGLGIGGVGVGGAAGQQNVTINENLKKMGNFFRRDNFGLGARFSGGAGGSAGGRREGSLDETMR